MDRCSGFFSVDPVVDNDFYPIPPVGFNERLLWSERISAPGIATYPWKLIVHKDDILLETVRSKS
jgi:hypothetical protein